MGRGVSIDGRGVRPSSPNSRPSGCPPLDGVRDFIARYLVLPGPWDAEVLTLWVAHTHLIDAFDVTPRLAFLSPQKASGKTRALELLGLLVERPISAVNTTAAALVHSIDQAGGHTTLLLDEVDTVFGSRNKGDKELQGVLNGGYKRGAQVVRAGSRRGPVERYDTSARSPSQGWVVCRTPCCPAPSSSTCAAARARSPCPPSAPETRRAGGEPASGSGGLGLRCRR